MFNLLFVKNIKEEMKQAYISNYDFSQENTAILWSLQMKKDDTI